MIPIPFKKILLYEQIKILGIHNLFHEKITRNSTNYVSVTVYFLFRFDLIAIIVESQLDVTKPQDISL